MRLAVLFSASLFATPALAQSVTVRDGNVAYRAAAGAAPRQLTRTGLDRDAVLSPDGRTIAFIRGTPGDSVWVGAGPEEATALWTMRVDGSGARLRVAGRAAEVARDMLAALQAPRFSPDGRRIYFLSAAWATSGAVHVLDVATGRERFLVAGNSLDVVPSGEYAGFLVVSQHRYLPAGGSYDAYWLFTPDGEEARSIGEDERALEAFRRRFVEPARAGRAPRRDPSAEPFPRSVHPDWSRSRHVRVRRACGQAELCASGARDRAPFIPITTRS